MAITPEQRAALHEQLRQSMQVANLGNMPLLGIQSYYQHAEQLPASQPAATTPETEQSSGLSEAGQAAAEDMQQQATERSHSIDAVKPEAELPSVAAVQPEVQAHTPLVQSPLPSTLAESPAASPVVQSPLPSTLAGPDLPKPAPAAPTPTNITPPTVSKVDAPRAPAAPIASPPAPQAAPAATTPQPTTTAKVDSQHLAIHDVQAAAPGHKPSAIVPTPVDKIAPPDSKAVESSDKFEFRSQTPATPPPQPPTQDQPAGGGAPTPPRPDPSPWTPSAADKSRTEQIALTSNFLQGQFGTTDPAEHLKNNFGVDTGSNAGKDFLRDRYGIGAQPQHPFHAMRTAPAVQASPPPDAGNAQPLQATQGDQQTGQADAIAERAASVFDSFVNVLDKLSVALISCEQRLKNIEAKLQRSQLG